MLRIIFVLSILFNIIYAEKLYYIQFGSFKKLHVLERSINRLPPEMRSHVVVVRSNGWYVPFAYHTKRLYALKQKLPSYRRYFPDAHISSSPYILNHPIIRDYTTTNYRRVSPPIVQRREEYVTYIPPPPTPEPIIETSIMETHTPYRIATTIPITDKESIIPTPRRVVKRKPDYTRFNKRILSGKHYYLAYKSKVRGQPDLLVKVSFKNHKVYYQPIIGNMSMKEAKYLVENDRLYMFADTFSEDGAFSKIEDKTDDYILVSSWFSGKKINTLRYYFNLNKAKRYLGKETSSQLATALEDGEFDRLQQAFIGVEGVYAIDDDEW